MRTVEYKDSEPPADAVSQRSRQIAHAADLGLVFYTGKQFPEKYRGGIFYGPARFWNRTVPDGGAGPLHSDQSRRSAGQQEVIRGRLG